MDAKGNDIALNGMKSNPPTGTGDAGFTFNNEFNALSAVSVLCGTKFTRYKPYMDDPEEGTFSLAERDYARQDVSSIMGIYRKSISGIDIGLLAATAGIVAEVIVNPQYLDKNSNIDAGNIRQNAMYDNGEKDNETFDDLKRIEEIEVKFHFNSKYDEAEFARQLADQEKGMNELTVQEYLDNRQQYREQGRAVESNAMQQAAREKAFVDKVDELQDSGLSLNDAEEQAQKWLNTQTALHNPDQVAGGNADNIGGVGDKEINSSIGAQWRYRIEEVDKQIEEISENMSEVERKTTYLNVDFTYEGE